MPKRDDIQSILILGAGPIVIGQACEFDYSGAQACKALREEGYRVVLVNSNPATIMTDPDLAHATYIEPVTWESVKEIIRIEKPDALLPTMGGQTALNCALDLVREGVLEAFGVELIGASREAIDKAEDRGLFIQAMNAIGVETARSAIAHSLEEAEQVQGQVGFPTIIRPSFTLGGSGGGIAYNVEEFLEICARGLSLSPTREILIEESLLGWKEFELEVVRDTQDNSIIICSIENLDPMGVHTGDSITVAPALTLTDKEYQVMRDTALAIVREIGVETGGANVQFASDPDTGRLIVIEMNPRVSRSSALASKATGFPIAKVAAKLAVGYTLDELKNEITGGATPASFEPTIDYVVTKIPRFNFEKFQGADGKLGTQMQSVGEVMALGSNFQESLQKALRGLEVGLTGFEPKLDMRRDDAVLKLRSELSVPGADRLCYVADAFRMGFSIEQVNGLTGIDLWFLAQIQELIATEASLMGQDLATLDEAGLRHLKRQGFSDARLAKLMGVSEHAVRDKRALYQLHPVYKRVDTCAAEFPTNTAYLYSTYQEECEALPTDATKIMVLGGGPNRIGQGIEFDYCCVHAVQALRAAGFETIMVNCNPETVSTDYDTADRLYFESLTLEDVLEIVRLEKPHGVIVHYGGQTPLKLARGLEAAGVPIIGTSAEAIDIAEDRDKFGQLVTKLGLKQPVNGTVTDVDSGLALARSIGYPLMVRPSYVLGGRAMEVVHNEEALRHYLATAVTVTPESPVLVDEFLDHAKEIDVDAVCDGESVLIGGIMEHIEEAGVHSGDSACVLPPFSLSESVQDELKEQMTKLAKALGVVGLINAQFALQDNDVYILEVNPRASRTVPFVSKVTGRPLAKIAALTKVGITLADQQIQQDCQPDWVAVKYPVFPFHKFSHVDPLPGPEMKSTGEVMGAAKTLGDALRKAHRAIGFHVKRGGKAFISVREEDKTGVATIARDLMALGYEIVATTGTGQALWAAGIPCQKVNKVREGRPHIVDMIKNGEISFVVNITAGRRTLSDSVDIRRSALRHGVGYTTTLSGAQAIIYSLREAGVGAPICMQDQFSKE